MKLKANQQNQPLACCICYKICKHPQVLPCCRSIVCKPCLKEWIEKQDTCPCCSAHLRVPKQKSLCKKHHKSLDYFCQTCNQSLCCDCLLEQIQSNDSQHANHKIIKASELKNQSYEDTQDSLKLIELLELLKNYSKHLDELFDRLQEQKKSLQFKHFNMLYQSNIIFDSFKREIDLAYQKKQQNYKITSDSLEEKMLKLQSILEESEIILTSDDPKMVPSAQNNIDKIKQINEELIPTVPQVPSLEFTNKLVPPLESFNFLITDFKKRLISIRNSTSENDHIFSDDQIIYGCLWRAKVFPNGTQVGKGTHLAVYVELLKGDQTPFSFNYQVEIFSNNDRNQNVNRRYTSVFRPMDSWGWNKIISIDKLLTNYLSEDGALSLKISIGPSSYQFIIQKKKEEYIQISNEWKQLKKNVEELKQKRHIDISDDSNSNNNEI